MPTSLSDQNYRTGDLEIALGCTRGSSQVHVILNSLTRHDLDSYSRIVARERGTGDDEQETLRKTDAGDVRRWRTFSLADICWIAMWTALSKLVNSSLDNVLTVVESTFLALEWAKAHDRNYSPGEEAVTFLDMLERFFDGNSEPFLLMLSQECVDVEVLERSAQGIPDKTILSDNPTILWQAYVKAAGPLGGAMSVLSFRSFIQPAIERMKSECKQKDKIPEVPDYREPSIAEVALTEPEDALISLIRDTPYLVPRIELTLKNHELRQIDFQQSFGPESFSPSRALKGPDVHCLKTYREDDGKVRRHVVEKRLRFP